MSARASQTMPTYTPLPRLYTQKAADTVGNKCTEVKKAPGRQTKIYSATSTRVQSKNSRVKRIEWLGATRTAQRGEDSFNKDLSLRMSAIDPRHFAITYKLDIHSGPTGKTWGTRERTKPLPTRTAASSREREPGLNYKSAQVLCTAELCSVPLTYSIRAN